MKHLIRIVAIAVLLATIPEVHADKAKPFVFAPTNSSGPFPVAVWLHGYRGYSAKGYFPSETATAMQNHAETLGLKQAHLLAPWLAREFFLILAAEFSSSHIKTCLARRRFIAAWRFPVIPAGFGPFFGCAQTHCFRA